MHLPIGLGVRTALADARANADLLAALIVLLNEPDARAVQGDEAAPAIDACRQWVRSQVSAPESAEFFDECIRTNLTGALVVAGRVESNNTFGARCGNWYIAAIDIARGTAVGDLIDFNPLASPTPGVTPATSAVAPLDADPNHEQPPRVLPWVIGLVAIAAVVRILYYLLTSG